MRKQRPSQPSSSAELQADESKMASQSLTTASKKATRTLRSQRQRNPVRAGLAVIAGRMAGALSRRLHLGGGTSIVGVVAQRVYPEIVEHLATELKYGSVMVTGTNGKTTTSSFIAAILRDDGLRVWRNREGSNLMGGVASSLVIRAQLDGHLRRSGKAISILEVDEAALPQIIRSVLPRTIVFTNLFRDQLDRYGEVNSIVALWKQAITNLPPDTTLVLNADDPTIAQLGDLFTGKVLYYGIDDPSLDLLTQPDTTARHQVIDARTCPICGHEYVYDAQFYSHMGHYHCPNCGHSRPQPDIRVTHVQMDSFDRLRIQVTANDQQHELTIPLPGLYNIYNALAAITVSLTLQSSWEAIVLGIEQSKPVFGRGERLQVDDKTIRLLLAKNPTGFNEVLRTVYSEDVPRYLLFVLNDNIADGQDISWIWDVDFERIIGRTSTLIVAGTRALDLAVRLKYAGINEKDMIIIPPAPLRTERKKISTYTRLRSRNQLQRKEKGRDGQDSHAISLSEPPTQRNYGIKNALTSALAQTPVGETLFVVPTYTGLLELHQELEQRGLTPHYWEGRDA
ncbi:MAG: Mur ligase family protein [Ktedonobacteraceae bacterium]|nr:Mur ligase family protein [Ktedonobacteraceae bacterium]